VQNGVVEQDGVLRHDGHVGAQGRLRNLAYVLPIHFDHPRGGIVEAEQQPQRTGLPAACGPSQAIHVSETLLGEEDTAMVIVGPLLCGQIQSTPHEGFLS
jgi:hypothetical protein